MPNFASVFIGNNLDRKLTKDEMIRSLRFSISAELEAIVFYDQLAKASDNSLFKRVMLDIANEESVHLGEFIRVLFELNPDEKNFMDKGFDEVQDIIKKPSKL